MLWRSCFWLIEEGRPTLNTGSSTLWAELLIWMKRGKQTECQHSSPCFLTADATGPAASCSCRSAFRTSWIVPSRCEASWKLPSLNRFRQSNEKSNPDNIHNYSFNKNILIDNLSKNPNFWFLLKIRKFYCRVHVLEGNNLRIECGHRAFRLPYSHAS